MLSEEQRHMGNEAEAAKDDHHDDWTFADAIASKPPSHAHLTDAQWYVAMVVVCCRLYEGIDPGPFRFNIHTPNPEIQNFFDRQVPPHLCAVELFQVRH